MSPRAARDAVAQLLDTVDTALSAQTVFTFSRNHAIRSYWRVDPQGGAFR